MSSKGIKLKDVDNNIIYPCPYYPIGSLYLSLNNINPSKFFGGKWQQIEDVFLLACGSTYKAGSTGGEASHTLTIDEMPSHDHNSDGFTSIAVSANGSISTSGAFGKGTGFAINIDGSGWWADRYKVEDWSERTKGGNQPHNNMPPYLAVYVWERIA